MRVCKCKMSRTSSLAEAEDFGGEMYRPKGAKDFLDGFLRSYSVLSFLSVSFSFRFLFSPLKWNYRVLHIANQELWNQQ